MSAILVHRKLISICQNTHVRLSFDSNNAMSEDLLVDISEKETQEQKRIEDTSSIHLSEYAKKLESHIRTRYLKKIEGIGVDPACLQGEKLDAECLPPIEATDLLSYLVLEQASIL